MWTIARPSQFGYSESSTGGWAEKQHTPSQIEKQNFIFKKEIFIILANFMLVKNEQNAETVVARQGATFGQTQCTSFYASFVGHLPKDQLKFVQLKWILTICRLNFKHFSFIPFKLSIF